MGHGFIPPPPWADKGNRSNDTLSHVEMVKTKVFWPCWSSRSREWRGQVAGGAAHPQHCLSWAGHCMSPAPDARLLRFIAFYFSSLEGFLNHSKVFLVMFLSLGLRTCWQSHFLPTATLQLLNVECCHITSFSDRAFQVFNLSFKWFHGNAMIILLL